ncbi:MAG TPA: hypothetical protein VG692_20765 [Gemmatimonadales bacterium]|nr:hypothetical protein [Gemmatimonadales bacterium]
MPDIYPIFVFEVALAIDLDAAERSLAGSARQTFRHRGRATSFFQYRPAPLRVSQEGAQLPHGTWRNEPRVDLVLYDFGAASVAYEFRVPGALDEVKAASVALRRSEALRQDARQRVEALLQSVGGAAQKPRVADYTEDYTIIGIREPIGGVTAQGFCDANVGRIAEILRPDAGGLSPEEITAATEIRISFGPRDVTVVDWDAAFVLDPEPEDVRAVLEFANVQLLEMRWLDLQLDQAIERSYHLLAPARGWRRFVARGVTGDVRRVAELQLESAVLLERVTNALKVFGEEYLARIYRLAAKRFQLDELDTAITQKLATIESIYQKLSDRAATIRMEMLEWVVIILIAGEILISVFGSH